MTRAALIAAAFLLAGCATQPPPAPPPPPPVAHPNSLAAQMSRPWRPVSGPLNREKFERDKSTCQMNAHMAPVGAGSPDVKFIAVFLACMRGQGYTNDL